MSVDAVAATYLAGRVPRDRPERAVQLVLDGLWTDKKRNPSDVR
jgi:hypothetical protein